MEDQEMTPTGFNEDRDECRDCGNNEEHLCPFALEVHDRESTCRCCEYHTQECKDNI